MSSCACSRRYVLCAEYFAEELQEVPYRGQDGALFKQDFGARLVERCPQLELVDRGFLRRCADASWDDVTYWVYRLP